MEKIKRLINWLLDVKEGQKVLAISLFLNVILSFAVAALSGRNEALHNASDKAEERHAIEMKEVYTSNNEFLKQAIFDAQRMKDSLFMANIRTEELRLQLKNK